MAALRKKYQGRADIVSKADSSPVASEPPVRTTLPPVDDSPPPEDLSASAQSEPVEQAEKAAIKQRLAELERAESVAQQPDPPQLASEPRPQQISPLEQVLATVPVAARGWLRSHPEYLSDPEKNAEIQHAHLVSVRESGDDEFGPQYYARLEQHLGLSPPQPQRARCHGQPCAGRLRYLRLRIARACR